MTARARKSQVEAARIRASKILALLEIDGVAPAEAIEMTKGAALTPMAIRTAGMLTDMVAFDLEVLTRVLMGDLDDATLARFEVPETPAAQLRMTPAAVADVLLEPTVAPVEPPASARARRPRPAAGSATVAVAPPMPPPREGEDTSRLAAAPPSTVVPEEGHSDV